MGKKKMAGGAGHEEGHGPRLRAQDHGQEVHHQGEQDLLRQDGAHRARPARPPGRHQALLHFPGHILPLLVPLLNQPAVVRNSELTVKSY